MTEAGEPVGRARLDLTELAERAVERAVFGGERGRREFIRRVGAGTAAATLASVFPMAAAKALAQDKPGPRRAWPSWST